MNIKPSSNNTAHCVYLGLGANLQDPIAQITSALKALRHLPNTELIAWSHLYSNPPIKTEHLSDDFYKNPQPDFINACAQLHTQLSPERLLQALQRIEHEQGKRLADLKWSPRTLDLDILMIDNNRINTEYLTIPHPEMHRRPFVLIPLQEIAPELVFPDGNSINFYLKAFSVEQTLSLNKRHKPDV